MDTGTAEYEIAYALLKKLGRQTRREILEQPMADYIAKEITTHLRRSGWDLVKRPTPQITPGYPMGSNPAEQENLRIREIEARARKP